MDASSFDPLLPIQQKFAEHAPNWPSERIDRRVSADRIVARTVQAPRPLPSEPVAAHDGFAVCSNRLPGSVDVWGRLRPGERFAGPMARSSAVGLEAQTLLPEGADAVVSHRDVIIDGETLRCESSVAPGTGVVPVGADTPEGEVVLPRGVRVRSAHLLWLKALGIELVDVVQRPCVEIDGHVSGEVIGFVAAQLERLGASAEVNLNGEHATEVALIVQVGGPHLHRPVHEPVPWSPGTQLQVSDDEPARLRLEPDPLLAWCGLHLLASCFLPPGCWTMRSSARIVWTQGAKELVPSEGEVAIPVVLAERLGGLPLAERVRHHNRPWSVAARAQGVVIMTPSIPHESPVPVHLFA
ncbi:MAG: hypothetical protein ACFB9M_14350 [Myxococcota bacterium]